MLRFGLSIVLSCYLLCFARVLYVNATDPGSWSSVKTIRSSYSKISTGNALRCGKLCEKQDRCIAATFDNKLRMCYMHDDIVTATESSSSSRYLYKVFGKTDQKDITESKCDKETQIALPSAHNGGGNCYTLTDICPVENGYTYYAQYSLCYEIATDPISWNSAEKICSKDGGHLLLVGNSTVVSWLVDIALADYSSYDLIFIDGNDKEEEGEFKNYNNETMTWLSWAPGEPNNVDADEDCVSMYRWFNFAWIDVSCNRPPWRKALYICQVDTKT